MKLKRPSRILLPDVVLGCLWMAVILSACSPLSSSSRGKVDPHLEFATVRSAPEQFTGRYILAGGAIVSLSDAGDGSLLEVQRWEMSRYGILLSMADDSEHLLVHSPARLDKEMFTVGRLVTLCGRVNGLQAIPGEGGGTMALSLDLDEINLLDTPFRYGLHRNDDPSSYTRTPTYVPPQGTPEYSHPYDTTYWAYPYSPFTYRVR